VLFHYALVDDLISKEEFERRVDTKIEECGDLVDEPTAAMLVVGELGRQHVKIRELSGKSSLFSFFGKVIDKTEPHEFDRNDGEKGWVATLLLGDETGSVRIVLWDEKAGAAVEISIGDVLEIIGRSAGRGAKEIYALALRKATCEITCTIPAGGSGGGLSSEPVDLDVVILGIEPPRTFSRRDGTTAEMVEGVIGDDNGTARLVAWSPDLLADIAPGSAVHITAAKPNNRGEGRAYSLDEKSTVTVIDQQIGVPFTPIESVSDQGFYSVQGTVKTVQEPRSFVSRDGSASWVRNLCISDGNDEIRVVLWGDKALAAIAPGDRLEIYHASAKAGRFGGIELGIGRGSILEVPKEVPEEIVFSGTIIAGNGCIFIDNGKERFIVEGEYPHGSDLRICCTRQGNRIIPQQVDPIQRTPEEVMARLVQFTGTQENT
jgi:replication factor A1